MTTKASENDLGAAAETAEPSTDAIEMPVERSAGKTTSADETTPAEETAGVEETTQAEETAPAPRAPKAAVKSTEAEETAEPDETVQDEAEKAGKSNAESEAKSDAETDAETGTKSGAKSGAEIGAEIGAKIGAKKRKVTLTPAALTWAMVFVVLTAAIVTAVLQWQEADRRAEADATRQAIRARAGEFGRALLSYDHTKLGQARQRVMGMAADDFAKTFDVAFTGGLEGLITKMRADATATVRNTYLSDVDGSNAKAIVVMDSEVHSTTGTRRVLGSYLEMTLVKQKGRWLVSDVVSIGAIGETSVKPDGTPATPPTPQPGTGGN